MNKGSLAPGEWTISRVVVAFTPPTREMVSPKFRGKPTTTLETVTVGFV